MLCTDQDALFCRGQAITETLNLTTANNCVWLTCLSETDRQADRHTKTERTKRGRQIDRDTETETECRKKRKENNTTERQRQRRREREFVRAVRICVCTGVSFVSQSTYHTVCKRAAWRNVKCGRGLNKDEGL